jgi:6,7-dimethyl-8-ribityllumazine synthase
LVYVTTGWPYKSGIAVKKILIISAGFYKDYKKMLLEGAIAELDKAGVKHKILEVPGCFEIPAALSMAIKSKKYDGFVALGCVIRGETSHYDYVCNECASGINRIAIKERVAVGFGIITAENDKLALARADAKQKNVGGKAALACLAMIDIKEKMDA